MFKIKLNKIELLFLSYLFSVFFFLLQNISQFLMNAYTVGISEREVYYAVDLKFA